MWCFQSLLGLRTVYAFSGTLLEAFLFNVYRFFKINVTVFTLLTLKKVHVRCLIS